MINKDFLKLSVKFAVLLFCLTILDVVLGRCCHKLLDQQTYGNFKNASFNLDSVKTDIILLGSSRVQNDYEPAVFTKQLGMSTWNTGQGGQGLIYYRALERTILQRYSPKMIVLNIDPNALEGEVEYEKLSLLRPYSNNHLFVREALISKDKYERFKLYSNIYQFNSMFLYLIRHVTLDEQSIEIYQQGWKAFVGRDSNLVIPKVHDVLSPKKLDKLNPQKVNYLNEIISDVTKRNIVLVLSVAPNYYAEISKTSTMEYINKIKKQDSLYVIDLSADTSLVEKPDYYYNITHMNEQGARAFSEKLISCIQQNISANSKKN